MSGGATRQLRSSSIQSTRTAHSLNSTAHSSYTESQPSETTELPRRSRTSTQSSEIGAGISAQTTAGVGKAVLHQYKLRPRANSTSSQSQHQLLTEDHRIGGNPTSAEISASKGSRSSTQACQSAPSTPLRKDRRRVSSLGRNGTQITETASTNGSIRRSNQINSSGCSSPQSSISTESNEPDSPSSTISPRQEDAARSPARISSSPCQPPLIAAQRANPPQAVDPPIGDGGAASDTATSTQQSSPNQSAGASAPRRYKKGWRTLVKIAVFPHDGQPQWNTSDSQYTLPGATTHQENCMINSVVPVEAVSSKGHWVTLRIEGTDIHVKLPKRNLLLHTPDIDWCQRHELTILDTDRLGGMQRNLTLAPLWTHVKEVFRGNAYSVPAPAPRRQTTAAASAPPLTAAQRRQQQAVEPAGGVHTDVLEDLPSRANYQWATLLKSLEDELHQASLTPRGQRSTRLKADKARQHEWQQRTAEKWENASGLRECSPMRPSRRPHRNRVSWFCRTCTREASPVTSQTHRHPRRRFSSPTRTCARR